MLCGMPPSCHQRKLHYKVKTSGHSIGINSRDRTLKRPLLPVVFTCLHNYIFDDSYWQTLSFTRGL